MLCALSIWAGPLTITEATTGPILCETYPTSFVGGDGSLTATLSSSASVVGYPGSCTVTVTADLVTPGPIRPGFLTISLIGAADGSGGAGAAASFFLNGAVYGGCNEEGCSFPGTIPFMLGTPFEVSGYAFSTGVSQFAGAGGTVIATIQAYEIVYPPNPQYSPIYLETPEPSSLALTLADCVFGVLCVWGTRKSRERHRRP